MLCSNSAERNVMPFSTLHYKSLFSTLHIAGVAAIVKAKRVVAGIVLKDKDKD